MIVIAGGTGRLGSLLVRQLVDSGHAVRILTRNRDRADQFGDQVEVITGNVRDPDAVAAALVGAHTVISAIHGLVGTGKDNPASIDIDGNQNLIDAAVRAGVGRFVLMSIHGARPDHPMELARAKFAAETALHSSGLNFAIIRPTAFTELWIEQVGSSLLNGGPARIFGRGLNPVNFVSVHDVATYLVNGVNDPRASNATVDIGGAENISLVGLADVLADAWGKPAGAKHVPIGVMRVAATLLQPVKPDIARLIRTSIVMDSIDMSFHASESQGSFVGATTVRQCADRVWQERRP